MNIVDYIDWRGDITFEMLPFNPPDSLVFSVIPIFDFMGIVPQNGTVTLYEAVKEFFLRNNGDALNLGLTASPQMVPMLKKAAVAPRYRDLKLTLFRTEQSEERTCQFGALTVLDGRKAYACFRGTDDTLLGWKEDFVMSFQSPVASQKAAVEYLCLLDAALSPDEIITCGHSKGGNLAVYGAAFSSQEAAEKVTAVYSHDAPGFPAEIVADERYTALLPKIRAFVPQNSIIGMLLERQDSFTVVKSDQKGLFQHDCFSWQIIRDGFVRMERRTAESEIFGRTFRGLLKDMSAEELRRFTEALFELLDSANASTLMELADGRKELLKAMRTASPETRDTVSGAMRRLLQAGKQAAREYAAELSERELRGEECREKSAAESIRSSRNEKKTTRSRQNRQASDRSRH